MSVTICFLTENHGRGSPEDESEVWTSETQAFVAYDESKLEELNEYLVGFYEAQDYSYNVNTHSVRLSSEQYEALKKAILDEAAQERAINDSIATSDEKEV